MSIFGSLLSGIGSGVKFLGRGIGKGFQSLNQMGDEEGFGTQEGEGSPWQKALGSFAQGFGQSQAQGGGLVMPSLNLPPKNDARPDSGPSPLAKLIEQDVTQSATRPRFTQPQNIAENVEVLGNSEMLPTAAPMTAGEINPQPLSRPSQMPEMGMPPGDELPSDRFGWGGDPLKSAEYDAKYGKLRREQGLSENQIDHPGGKQRLIQAIMSGLSGAAMAGQRSGGDIGAMLGGLGAGAVGGAINPAAGRGLQFDVMEKPKLLADEQRGNQRLREQIAQEAAQNQIEQQRVGIENMQQDNARADRADTRAGEEWDMTKAIKGYELKQAQQRDQVDNQLRQLELDYAKEANPMRKELLKAQIENLKAQAYQRVATANQPTELSAADERNLKEMSDMLSQQAYTPAESSQAIQSYVQQAYKSRGISDSDFAKARDVSDPLGAKQAQERIQAAQSAAEQEGRAMHEAERGRLATVLQQELRERQGQMPTPGTKITERQLEIYRQRRGLRSLDEAKRVATALGYQVVAEAPASGRSNALSFRNAIKGTAPSNISSTDADALVAEALKGKK
jgi:hypothetical protein